MTIKTFAIEINDAAYTKIGSNVSELSILENYVGTIKIVVTDVGDSASAVSEANHIPVDGAYER